MSILTKLKLGNNIGSILFLAFSILSILIFLLVVSHFKEMRQLARIQSDSQLAATKMRHFSDLAEFARSRTRMTSQIIIEEDPFAQDELNMDLESYAGKFASVYQQINLLSLSDEERKILNRQESIVQIILPAQRNAVELAMSGEKVDKKTASEILFETVIPGQNDLISLFHELINLQQALIDGYSKNTEKSLEESLQRQSIIITFILLVFFVIAFWVIKKARGIQKELELTVEKRTEDLVMARDQAEQANLAKSSFLSSMSHEIRTPLNGIIGVFNILQDTSLDDEQKSLVETASSSADALINIISDILDFSKIEAGKLEIDNQPFSLPKLLIEISRLYDQLSAENRIEFKLNKPESLPSNVLGDRNRIRQILLNYLNNALKFTNSGTIELNVQTRDSEIVYFEVVDTGIGISTENQAKLFQDFSQADTSTTREYGGTGLGLAICKKLAELMDGSVGVESKDSKGSKFWLEIQLPSSKENPQQEQDENGLNLAGVSVLLVEDNQVNQLIARKLLKQMDINVTLAENGRDAVNVALNNTFDIVLMDCQMPVMDGYRATEELRKANYDKPIIALTANATKGDRQKCLDCGMDDFLSKPFKSENLFSLLANWRGLSHHK